MKLGNWIAGALLLGASLLGVATSAQANQTDRYYFQANDTVKSGSINTGQSNLYGVTGTGVSLPYNDANSHNVLMDFSAYSTTASGTGYVYYLTTTNSLIFVRSFGVTSCEQRYYFNLSIPPGSKSVAIYVNGASNPLRVRDFRAYFSPNSVPYSYASPQNFSFTTLSADDTLNSWPAITNGTSSGVGLSGNIFYNDARSNTTDHMMVSIQRYSDNAWWDGTSWGSCFEEIPAAHSATAWSFNQVPTGANLADGEYLIIVSSHDTSDSNPNPHYCTEKRIDLNFVNAYDILGRCVIIYPNSTYTGTDRSGATGAQVTLSTTGGTPVSTVTVDADGYYTFEDVAPGNYSISAQYQRDGSWIPMDPSPRSVTITNADISVDRFALYTCFGIIKKPDGTALSGATVKFYNANGVLLGTQVTGADGRYEFRGLRATNTTIKTTATGYTFTDQVVSTPTTGEVWSPCARRHITGTANPSFKHSSSGGNS